MEDSRRGRCLGKPDLMLCYWQPPLAPEGREVFTIMIPEGLDFPTRVSQGVSNTTAHFQATLAGLLSG